MSSDWNWHILERPDLLLVGGVTGVERVQPCIGGEKIRFIIFGKAGTLFWDGLWVPALFLGSQGLR